MAFHSPNLHNTCPSRKAKVSSSKIPSASHRRAHAQKKVTEWNSNQRDCVNRTFEKKNNVRK